jgi:tRNA threonylcarbamoyladenosine biosynthesis protein TsaE
MTYKISSIEELKIIVEKNIEIFKNKKILLYGDLGAGKTTFVKILAEMLGFKDISSPTFTIMNRYSNNGEFFIHLDLYRLNSLNDLENIGFFDYIDTNYTMAIEWADKIDIRDFINGYVEIKFDKICEFERIIKIKFKGE